MRPYMYGPPRPAQKKFARSLLPFLAWIFVAVSLRYGYYGDRRLVLGRNSSKMVTTGSLFVQQLEVISGSSTKGSTGVLLYGFSERPELSLEKNWTALDHELHVGSYARQGISMWLNKGSKLSMSWEVAYGGGSYERDMLVVVIKGEQNVKEQTRFSILSYIDSSSTGHGSREAQYTVQEDDSYYIGVVNPNPWAIATTLKVTISSKIYDTSRATSVCSTSNGMCKIKLHLLRTNYFVITTPDDNVPDEASYVDISFAERLVAYIVIIGVVVFIISFILKHLGACTSAEAIEQVPTGTETDPILPRKEITCTYGTTNGDIESGLCSSSEDTYDGKICVICYDEPRNCFFTPCGHNATCYTCAQRIMEVDNNLCPICRRLIHKTKKILP